MREAGVRRWRGLRVPAVLRRLQGRPLLLATIVVGVLASAWFGINVPAPREPLFLLWLFAPVSLGLTTYASWRTARIPTLRAPTRRFWRQFAVAVVLVGFGTLSQAYDTFGGPTISQHISPRTLTCYGAGIVMIIWMMYRLPLGDTTPGARLRLGLDAGTVVLATAVFLWHFQTKPLLESGADQQSSILGSGIVMTIALVAVFAVAKVIMSASAFVDPGSLRLLALAVMVGALGDIPQTYIRDKPHLLCPQVSIPIIAVFAVLAAERQHRAADRAARGEAEGARRRRPYSVLPYLAVAAVDILLVGLAATGRYDDLAVVSVAAVALTALVILRQLTAFQDNGRLLARLDHNANHDALTQLPNRMLFERRLHRALDSGARTRQTCVALLDLNDFKLVNDTLGHGVGDALLVGIAPRLVGSVRSRDTVARLGGDEFVVVFDDIDEADVEPLVRRMMEALGDPVLADGHELALRASIGLAMGSPGDDPTELLRQADVAMYAAKSIGKATGTSHFVHYRTELDTPGSITAPASPPPWGPGGRPGRGASAVSALSAD